MTVPIATQSPTRKSSAPRRRSIWLVLWTLLVMLFLWAPIGVVALFSFNDSAISAFPMQGFTFDWYRALARNSTIHESLLNSLKVAAIVVPVSTTLGAMAAIAISRYVRRMKSALNVVIVAPVLMPPMIIGISLLTFFGGFDIRLNLITVAAGHVTLTMPFVTLLALARMVGFDTSLEEAATDLGASRITFLRRILLPHLTPALFAGALLAFTLSFDEIIVTFFTVGIDNTLPMYIWGQLRTGVTPEINALATLVVIVSVLIAVVALLIQVGQNRRRRAARIRQEPVSGKEPETDD